MRIDRFKELSVDEDALTKVIYSYFVILGARMYADKGNNEKISPSRELAKSIKSNLEKFIVIKKVLNAPKNKTQ